MAEVILHYSNFKIPEISGKTAASDEPSVDLEAQSRCESPLLPSQDSGGLPASWRISEEQKAIVFARWDAGDPMSQIAKAAGMAYSSARTLLNEQVEAKRTEPWRLSKLTEEQFAEAVSLYGLGWSFQALANRYGVSRQAMSKRLKAHAAKSDASPGST